MSVSACRVCGRLSVNISVRSTVRPSVFLFVCMSVCLFMSLFVCMSRFSVYMLLRTSCSDDGQADRQTDEQIDRQISVQINRQTHRQIDRHIRIKIAGQSRRQCHCQRNSAFFAFGGDFPSSSSLASQITTDREATAATTDNRGNATEQRSAFVPLHLISASPRQHRGRRSSL